MRVFIEEEVRLFVRRYARSYFDLQRLELSQVSIEPMCDYCDWYVAVDARPEVADIAYFLVDQFEDVLHVSGVEY